MSYYTSAITELVSALEVQKNSPKQGDDFAKLLKDISALLEEEDEVKTERSRKSTLESSQADTEYSASYTTVSSQKDASNESSSNITANSDSTSQDKVSESDEKDASDTSTEYVFRPGFFTMIQQMVEMEIAMGRDPEVTLDGTWRWYDSVGNQLSEPIPLDIEGHAIRPIGSEETYWVDGPDPYTAYWLNDSETTNVTSAESPKSDSGSEVESPKSASGSEEESDTTQYVFRPGFFTMIKQMVEMEIAMGRDPEVSLDGTWRWYDSVGNQLSEPIPLDIEGHAIRPIGSEETYWVGGPDPYTAYWLNDEQEQTQT